jgi:hypothetical protein
MFEGMIDNYIQRARPVATEAASEARAWARAILDELRLLRATVADDDNTVFFRHTVNFINLPGGENGNLDQAPQHELQIVNNSSGVVPPNEEWELEVISTRGMTTSGTFIIYRNNYRIITTTASQGGMSPVSGNGLRFQGGDVIGYAVAAGVPGTFECYMQFRIKKPGPSRSVRNAPAWESPTPTRASGDDQAAAGQVLPRHTGTIFQGVNPVGTERAKLEGNL